MKTLKLFIILQVVVLLLFSLGCNKDVPLKLNDGIMHSNSGNKILSWKDSAVKKTFRNIQVKGTFKSESTKPLDVEKLNAAINERKGKQKKNIKVPTVSDAVFTATDMDSYYSCHVESQNGGTLDYYLIDTYANTWTHIGETNTGYIDFYIDRPYTYNNYVVWTPSEAFTNDLNFGDTYSGVTVSNGVLEFTNQAAYDALYARLASGYEAHQASFFDTQSSSLSDDDLDALAVSQGFDEFLVQKDFSAYWASQGVTSLISVVQGEVAYWFTQEHDDMSDYPEDNYYVDDIFAQSLLNSDGEIIINNTPISYPVTYVADSPGETSCRIFERVKDEEPYASNRVLKKKIIINGDGRWSTSGIKHFSGKSLTFRKGGWLNKIFNKAISRKRNKLYGYKYDSNCSNQEAYNTGLNNSAGSKRYRCIVDYVNSSVIQTKENETTLEILLNSNTYTLVFTN